MAVLSMFGKHFSNFCSYVLVFCMRLGRCFFSQLSGKHHTHQWYFQIPPQTTNLPSTRFVFFCPPKHRQGFPALKGPETKLSTVGHIHAMQMDGTETPTKFMEDLEHIRWKLLRQAKRKWYPQRQVGYFRSHIVSVLEQCDVSLLTCFFCFQKKDAHRENCLKIYFNSKIIQIVQSFCKPFHRKECKCSAPNTS